MKSILALGAIGAVCLLLAGCGGGDAAPRQKVQPKPVDPSKQVNPPDKTFKDSFKADNKAG